MNMRLGNPEEGDYDALVCGKKHPNDARFVCKRPAGSAVFLWTTRADFGW
jgi:hypothetical protein